MTSADLVSARKRVEARRAQHRQNQRQHQSGAYSDDVSARRKLSPVERVQGSVTGVWNILRGYEGTKPASRVRQVDTELLDQELLGLLQGQVGEALKFYRVSLSIHYFWMMENQWKNRTLIVFFFFLLKNVATSSG